MYKVHLMLIWEDSRWLDGEYVYISTHVCPSKVERLAVKTYNNNLAYTALGDSDRRPVNVAVYHWNPSEIYQIINDDLVKLG